MVNYADESLFLTEGIGKQVTITYDGGTLTNSDLIEDQFTLEESLCSEEELRFGCCEASCLKFRIGYGATSLLGKQLTVSTLPTGAAASLQLGVYKVYSDTPTADRRWRDIVAYDAMYEIINSEVSDWYNTILPDDETTVTLQQFRNSFFTHFGITQETASLPNDSMTVEQTIAPSELSGMTVIRAICEINGCFGHINRSGNFEYKFLQKGALGLFPAEDLYPSETLYPEDPTINYIGNGGTYLSATYEDYETALIDKLQVRQEENDIGAIIGTGTNCYIIQDNFLVYGKSAADLQTIAQAIYDEIKAVQYRPLTLEAVGNPCLEVGDSIAVYTTYQFLTSYVLRRSLRGIQALFDTFEATGSATQPEQVNSVNTDIIQLKGKTNTLERNVEETRSTITSVESGLQSQITQNANGISAEVTRATAAEGNLSSRITQNANGITAEVTRATGAEGNLSSLITQNANAITLKVSKGDVSSEISQEAGQISISSNRLVISSTNFSLAADGTLTASNGTFSGTVTASSGTIGGFTIGSYELYNGKSELFSSSNGVYVGRYGIGVGNTDASSSSNRGAVLTYDGSFFITSNSYNNGNGNPGIYVQQSFYSAASQVRLWYDCIRVGLSSKSTTITDTGFNVRNNTSYDTTLSYGTLASDTTLSITAGSTLTATAGGDMTFSTSGNANLTSSGSSKTVKVASTGYGGDVTIQSGSSGDVTITTGSYGNVYIGTSSSYLGFFGTSTKATKQSVSSVTGTTVDAVKTGLNNLITALKKYNLI